MSISRAQSARLGVFVAAGSLLLAGFLFISLGVKFSQKTKKFHAYFVGESMSGLEQSATVKYSGVPIGKVEKIAYLPNDISKVKVTLSVQEDFPMKEGMYAETGMLGITGLKYVEIMGGTNAAPLLKPGAEIPTRVSMFSSISGKAEVIVAKIELLLNNINSLSNPDSLKSLRVMLDNVAAITSDARRISDGMKPRVDTITEAASKLLVKIDNIAGDVENFTGTLDSTLSAKRLANTVSLVDSTAVSLKQLSDNLALMVRQSREDFTVTMQNLREASESANELAKVLAENPSLMLKGEAQKERAIR
jgi:phospholipid/cholesterol/gamma-HCH transport system substrate-binding protein